MRCGASIRSWLIAVAGFAFAGCTKPNPLNCADGGACSDPAFPFCDVDGSISGTADTCISVSCPANQFFACRGNDALTCDQFGTNYNVMQCPQLCVADKGGCVDCSMDEDCPGAAPACSPTGQCVECVDNSRCTDSRNPVCNTEMNTCVGCVEDTDCTSLVCDAVAGNCIAQADVIYASPTGGTSGCGTSSAPCNLATAMLLIDASHTVLKMLPGDYTGSVSTSGRRVTIHGAGATLTTPDDTASESILVDAGSVVVILGLKVKRGLGAGTNPAIRCNGTSLALDRVEVAAASSGVVGCPGTVTRSRFVASQPSGPLSLYVITGNINASTLSIERSTFVGGRGVGFGLHGAANITNCVFLNEEVGVQTSDVTSNVSFSTFFNSPVVAFQNTAHARTGTFTNNIMFSTGATDVASGDGGVYAYNLMTPQSVSLGTDHIISGDPKFKDPANGDVHLMASSPAINSADPVAPLQLDFDGDPRPVGTAPDLGAYEAQP